MSDTLTPTDRFSGRADAYDRARPGYPDAFIDHLCAGLPPGARVADVGAGTGILSVALVARGLHTDVIEPNPSMLQAAARRLDASCRDDTNPHEIYKIYKTYENPAEATGLPAGSVALVVAAQAFHWFDPQAARREFARVLAPGGRVALLWNDPQYDASAFMSAYRALIHAHRLDDPEVSRRGDRTTGVARFFGPEGCHVRVHDHSRPLDAEALLALITSSSYLPGPEHPGHAALLDATRALFEAHQAEGVVTMRYCATLYLGALS